jgi:GLPGLI family protein
MKKLIIAVLLTVLVNHSHLFAQEGVITYEVTINNHRMLTGEREGMKAMVPEFRVFKQELYFNASTSLYKPLIEDEEEEDQHQNQGGHGGRVRLQFAGAGGTNYFDQSTSQILSQVDLMGKKYLIVDTLKTTPWKFGTETKNIQGYECMQAYYTNENSKQTITAWYTAKLRPMLGPEKYNSLPGTVLAVDVDNGERVLVAKKIETRPLEKNELKAPTEGQKVSQAEFRKIAEETRKKFNGTMMIRN